MEQMAAISYYKSKIGEKNAGKVAVALLTADP